MYSSQFQIRSKCRRTFVLLEALAPLVVVVCVTCVSKFVSVSVLVVYTGRIGFSVSLLVMSVCAIGFLLVSL